jgi:hypothetical protein
VEDLVLAKALLLFSVSVLFEFGVANCSPRHCPKSCTALKPRLVCGGGAQRSLCDARLGELSCRQGGKHPVTVVSLFALFDCAESGKVKTACVCAKGSGALLFSEVRIGYGDGASVSAGRYPKAK